MSDVLNPGELTMLALFEADIQKRIDGIGDTLIRDELQVASMVHRLVAEVGRLQAELLATVGRHADVVKQVARLRARNEALERVAKAAAGLFVDDDQPGEDFIESHVADRIEECLADDFGLKCESLRDALSALNPSETPNSSGGDT